MRSSTLALAERKLAPTHGLSPTSGPSKKNRLRFTERTLAALPLPANGQVQYYDEVTPGFVCRCSKTQRTLYAIKRQHGAHRPVWIRLGRLGDKPLAEFRIEAQEYCAQLAGGSNPTTGMSRRGASTFGGDFDDYLAAKAKLASRTVATYKADFDAFVGTWRTRPITSITASEVARRHQERSVESPARADGALRILRAVERYAKARAAARNEVLNTDLLALVRAARAWNNVTRRATHLDDKRRGHWM